MWTTRCGPASWRRRSTSPSPRGSTRSLPASWRRWTAPTWSSLRGALRRSVGIRLVSVGHAPEAREHVAGELPVAGGQRLAVVVHLLELDQRVGRLAALGEDARAEEHRRRIV